MGKKKKILLIFLIIIVIIVCVYLGFKTRYSNKIKITQVDDFGYVLVTKNNNLIIIDGGGKENTKKIEKIIKEFNNLVTAWIITSPEENKIGALTEIIDSENDITVNNLLYSFDYSEDWFNKLELEENQKQEIEQNIKKILLGKYQNSLVPVARRAQYQFDNFYITILEGADSNSYNIEDQRVILKIDNTFKNIIFFGDISEDNANIFIENDKDVFKCDGAIFRNNITSEEMIMKYINPKVVFSNNKLEYHKIQVLDFKENEITYEMW